MDTAPSGPLSVSGEPLASWTQRLAAYLIDLATTTLVVGAPTVIVPFELIGGSKVERFGVLLAVSIAINVVYHAAFLRWRAATPGKWLLGLKVRAQTRSGALTWHRIALRVGSQYGVFIALSVVYLHLIDGLWPLWDDRRESLHDKLAATCVVKVSAGGTR